MTVVEEVLYFNNRRRQATTIERKRQSDYNRTSSSRIAQLLPFCLVGFVTGAELHIVGDHPTKQNWCEWENIAGGILFSVESASGFELRGQRSGVETTTTKKKVPTKEQHY